MGETNRAAARRDTHRWAETIFRVAPNYLPRSQESREFPPPLSLSLSLS